MSLFVFAVVLSAALLHPRMLCLQADASSLQLNLSAAVKM
jgi:hypothetical protein